MKNLIYFGLVLSLSFLFTSCLKEDHSIRLRNDYYEQINNVKIGNANIGTVLSNRTSEYKSINTGNFNISGTSVSGQVLSGSGSISGKGKHKWTVTLSASGTLGVKEDK